MDLHHGQIVERVIRRNGYSISELSRLAHVNRRSVYNWFNQKHLKPEIIFRIGCALKHDFSIEFPHLFSKDDFKVIFDKGQQEGPERTGTETTTGSSNWKDKYINLLEQYNKLLLDQLKNENNLPERSLLFPKNKTLK